MKCLKTCFEKTFFTETHNSESFKGRLYAWVGPIALNQTEDFINEIPI
jgi:hypothetical protein